MKITELRQKTAQELTKMLEAKRLELAELAVKMRTGEFKAVHEPRQLRKQIAHIRTVMREQTLSESRQND